MKLGDFVSFTHGSAVPLLQVGRTPGTVKMMNGYGTFLGVHTCAEHGGGTEQHAYCSLVHACNERLSCLVGLGFLNEAYLLSGYAVVFHQLALDFGIGIPFAWLIRTEITEYKLRSFLLLKLVIVFRNLGGTVGGFVVHMISVLVRINKPQI